MLAETVILMVTFTYFICVTGAYKSGMWHEGEAWVDPDAPEEKEEEAKSSKKAESEKKSGDAAEEPAAAEE